MKNIRVIIEMSSEGRYSCYMDNDDDLDYSVIGTGATVEEAKKDFDAAYAGMREHYQAKGKPFEEVNYEFAYDVPSFLAYYKDRLSLVGLQRITGIAQGQLSHYVTGRRHPSKKTVAKIQSALNSFGASLSNLTLL